MASAALATTAFPVSAVEAVVSRIVRTSDVPAEPFVAERRLLFLTVFVAVLDAVARLVDARLAEVFFGAAFFAVDFFAVVFFAVVFLAAVFVGAAFLLEDFLAVGFDADLVEVDS